MNRGPYKLDWILRDVAAALRSGSDWSATTIRCAINDDMDRLQKEGFKVRERYAQDRAVKRVKRMILNHGC